MVAEEEDHLARAKRRLEELKCVRREPLNPQVEYCRNIAKEIYAKPSQPFQRKLPTHMCQLVLEELEKIVNAGESSNEKTLNAILSLLPFLLSPNTKSFRTQWLLSCCPSGKKDSYQLQVINLLVEHAPNLKYLSLDDSKGVKPSPRFPLISKEMKTAIAGLHKLKSLSTGRYFIADKYLIKLCKSLQFLRKLHANVIFNNKRNLSKLAKTMQANMRHLRQFCFDRIAIKDGKKLQDDYQVLPKELVKHCLENIPRLQIVKTLVTDPKSRAMDVMDSIKGPSNLRHVHLSSNSLPKKIIPLPQVTHFKMTWRTSLSTSGRKFSTIQRPYERTLDYDSSPIPDFPNLEYLHLEDLSLSVNLVRFVVQYGQTLHTLVVDTRAGTNLIVNLADLSCHCPNVKTLHLGGIKLSAGSSTNSFPHLNDLKLVLLNRRKPVMLSNLLAVPDLVKVDIKAIEFDTEDLVNISSQVRNGLILKNLECFRLDCMSYETIKPDEFSAISDLVKSACAFLPNMKSVRLDVTFFPPLPPTSEQNINENIPVNYRKKAAIFEALGDRSLIWFLIEFAETGAVK